MLITKCPGSTPIKAAGVVAASAGNHAQGVALAAGKLGLDAVIVMPVTTPAIKVEAVKRRGARVVLHGDTFDDAADFAQSLVATESRTYLPPFDDPDVIAGQGTVALELVEQAPQDFVFIPCGGGGLLAGMAVFEAPLAANQSHWRGASGCSMRPSGEASGFKSHPVRGGIIRRWLAVARVGEETTD